MAAKSEDLQCLSVSALLDEIEAGFSPSKSPKHPQGERYDASSDDKENRPCASNLGKTMGIDERYDDLQGCSSFVRQSSRSNGSSMSTSVGSSHTGGTTPTALQNMDWRRPDNHDQENYKREISKAKKDIEQLERAIKDKEAELKSMEAADALRWRARYIEHLQGGEWDAQDFEEMFALLEAKALSLQSKEVACARDSSFTNEDFDEEIEFQEARALSMQPRELVCPPNDHNCSIDFDEEYDYQEARLLSLQPRDVALGLPVTAHNDSCIDFDAEYDLQEARSLSMQPWRYM